MYALSSARHHAASLVAARGARVRQSLARVLPALVLGAGLGACGGSGNPLGNPASLGNTAASGTLTLSYAYFQRCVFPVLTTAQPLAGGGSNTCAASGCHSAVGGTGGALRVDPAATLVDLSLPANTPTVVRASAMYRNFVSAQAEVSVAAPLQSLLLDKPLLRGVLHGGGQIFATAQDAGAVILAYWINHPMPSGQDEFSTAAASLFTPADVNAGACNTQ